MSVSGTHLALTVRQSNIYAHTISKTLTTQPVQPLDGLNHYQRKKN
jgi:hypothetical protein